MSNNSMIQFSPVRSPTRMSEAIVRQIENKILLGQLKPHSILPSETKLMSQFGVSRNTVREALRMLEASGMIRIKQGAQGGAVVTELTVDFVSEFLIKAIHLGGVSGDSLSQFRLALEPSIAELLAKKDDLDPKLISEMEENVLHANAIYKMNRVTRHQNIDFHVLLALATENPLFIILLKTLRISLQSFVPPHVHHKLQIDTIRYHEKILDAIKKRDSVGAKEKMYKHLMQMREVIKGNQIRKLSRRASELLYK
jgi:GntR family transcriptional repressor for pyruvate dehydrogenase complex